MTTPDIDRDPAYRVLGRRCCGAKALLRWPARSPPTAKTAVDLRPILEKWGLDARVQGNRGTCSVFAINAVIEYAVASKQQHGTRLSVEFLNWAANEVDSTPVDGGMFLRTLGGLCRAWRLPRSRHAVSPPLPTRATSQRDCDRPC